MTGAGISAPSGVPTFRGEKGLWKSYRPEELATPGAFQSDPELVWEWYQWRRQLIAECQPNAAHEILQKWNERYSQFTLITQNVDGLHERAGSTDAIRFHGSIWLVSCYAKCDNSPTNWWDETFEFENIPPKCPYCDDIIRPGVVWFGEGIDPHVLSASSKATKCDIFFSIGTSAVVQPAASLLYQAKSQGAYTVEINLDPTPSTGLVDLSLQGSADQQMEEIEKQLSQ